MEERLRQLEAQLEEKNQELLRVSRRNRLQTKFKSLSFYSALVNFVTCVCNDVCRRGSERRWMRNTTSVSRRRWTSSFQSQTRDCSFTSKRGCLLWRIRWIIEGLEGTVCCPCCWYWHPASSQNALIRELDHTKKLIEESHHEKVRDHLLRLFYASVFFPGGEFGLRNDGVFL